MKLQQTQKNITYKKEFLINDFKEKLDILEKYSRFSNLENLVLTPAKTNINKHSDIHLEYRIKRKGRTPISIIFKAKYKNKSNKLNSLNPENFKLVKEVENQQNYNVIKPTEEAKKNSKNKLKALKKLLTS